MLVLDVNQYRTDSTIKPSKKELFQKFGHWTEFNRS